MGHITPLICLNNEFKNEYKIVYFGLKDSMEEEVCKRNNITFFPTKLYPFYTRNLLKNIKTFYYIFKEKNRIKKAFNEGEIKAIISSGGYASIPVNLAFRKPKKLLLEPNTTLGLANQFLSYFVDKICVQFPTIKGNKISVTGSPISILKSDFDHPFFYQNKPLILFVGGSNGALEIVKICNRFQAKYKDVNIILITGDRYYETYDFGPNLYKVKKINNLNGIFQKFDVIVSRAGASTITEILLTNTASVLIPSPNVSKNHQFFNADYMKKLDLALVLDENGTNIEDEIYHFLNDKNRISIIKNNINKHVIKDSVERIKKIVL